SKQTEVKLVREDLIAVRKERRSNMTKKTEKKLGEATAKDF
ncbi:312_t:CDS:1, partial [Racocetra persica]